MKTVVVIDYGMSNLRSVSKAIESLANKDWHIVVSDQASVILKADKVVFPGQGAIGNCMTLLHKTGMVEVLQQILRNKPFLGICLGLQTLLTSSAESGGTQGLNRIQGTVLRFADPLVDSKSGERLKVPHMGWNQVYFKHPHSLWKGIAQNSRFYFVHSYYVNPQDEQIIAATTSYGGNNFVSAIAQENLLAVQFHPEKSQHVGLTLLRNFLEW